MKKFLFKSTVTILLLTIVFSCTEKNSVIEKKHINPIYKENPRPPFSAIAKADWTGALAGAGGMALIEKQAGGTNEQVATAAIIGGVIGGALASWDKWNEKGKPDGAEKGTGGVIVNNNNPMNSMGIYHYLVLDIGLEDLSTFSYNPYSELSTYLAYNTAVNKLVEIGAISITDTQYYTLQDCRNQIDFWGTYSDSSQESQLFYLWNAGMISDTAYSLLLVYYETLQGTDQIEDFQDYSINLENGISESAFFEYVDKIVLLGTMATTRYSLFYWSDQD